MKILMVGDVIGKGGRLTLAALLPSVKQEFGVDFVCVQGENSAAGFGITRNTADEILAAGADVITSGNHIWDKKEIIPHLTDRTLPLLRPLNYPDAAPGIGATDTGPVAVINLIGRVFLGNADCPFIKAGNLLEQGFGAGKPIVVDIHAEASSEKQALAWYLDGKVTAVCGTHTHVPTADLKLYPKGTAFATDIGMVGAVHSVVGMAYQNSLRRFTTGVPERFKPVEKGLMQFNSILIDTNGDSHAISITRIDRRYEI